MARFIRDERRIYPLTWIVIGGIFFMTAGWAVYAELVTRVPWEDQQKAFFDMELEQSKQGLAQAQSRWDKEIEPSLKKLIDRRAELDASMKTGDYAESKKRIDQLNRDFSAAETNKTFGGSDLDEAYYYRELAEYARDRAGNAVRACYADAYASEDPKKAQTLTDAMYEDPPPPPKGEATTEKMYHLESEIDRNQAHIKKINEALSNAPSGCGKVLQASRDAEQLVVDKVEVEVKNQKRVDAALADMAKIDGPAEPQIIEKDPTKVAAAHKAAREAACKGNEDTRSCINWLHLEPVDLEMKAIDVEIAKNHRPLTDAQLRESLAETRAHPKAKLDDIIHTIVGPFQIRQTVTRWIAQERDVDIEQVDRCQTCHMGADSSNYPQANLPRQFRTHPYRGTLFSTHPVEQFGCTSCHQGQGRATDMLSHSGWQLTKKDGKERWHFEGDEFWEDPLLPVGELTKIIVDDRNDTFEVRLGKDKWAKIAIDHKNPAEHDKDSDIAAYYAEETERPGAAKPKGDEPNETFFGALQEKLSKVVEGDKDVAAKWHAVVRKTDNRMEIGLEQNDPNEHMTAKETPAFAVRFPKPEAAQLLGFNATGETVSTSGLVKAAMPPSAPVRSDGMQYVDKDGRYHPPRGADGLQIPDDMRNRFIQALPEVESGCLKCHVSDTDLKSRASRAQYNIAKLDYEKGEALKKKSVDAYKKAHDGSEALPVVPPDPAEVVNPVPTLSEGRALFKKLNCTGCHILDGFTWDRNTGPELNNITSKVSPEWVLTWIRNPRGWREKTRMPNLWPKPLDPASKRPFAKESPEYQQYLAQMRDETVDIASFLVEKSENPSTRVGASKDAKPLEGAIKGYADVPGSTADKGKKIFESYGCQGCHAREDRDTADEKLPEPWRSRERDIAPTLANIGGKTGADWIAYWVEQPNRYWHGTKMPNLRLSHEEAASVGKYLAGLKSKPLDAAEVDKSDTAIVTDSAKRNERVACANANGQMLTRVECGERLIGYYGCFGCHQIAGFDQSAPIAPELSGFAKKDLSTLDFGYAIADHHLQTTETFASLKLDSPRIYRRDRIELKMADFDFSPREIRSLVVFLKGLVNNKPKTAYKPADHPEYAAALEGRQIIDDYNCRACHMIEERGADIDNYRQGQLASDAQARAPWLNGEGMRVQPEWLFGFLRDPGKNGIRPWLHPEWAYGNAVPDDKMSLRMPTFNFSPEQVTAVVRYFASWDQQEYPYLAANTKVHELGEVGKLYALTHMMSTEAGNCLSCHFQGEFPVDRGRADLGKMAPNFNNVARRLRPEWARAWILKPQNWLPYTKMTAFFASVDRPRDAEHWPGESDPYLTPAAGWNKAPSPIENITGEQQAEIVRDFLFSLPPDAVFPKPGEDIASSPLVKPRAAEQPRAEEEQPPADTKGKKPVKPTVLPPTKKKTGSIGVPTHG